MKLRSLLSVLLLLPVFVRAETKFPKGVFFIRQYEQALQTAAQKKKPLAVIMVGRDASGMISDNSEEAFKSVAELAVAVVVYDCDELNDLAPPLVTAAFAKSTPEGVMPTPLLMLCSPAEDIVWKVVATVGDDVKVAKTIFPGGVAEAKPAITAYFSTKTAPEITPPGDKQLIWPTLQKGSGHLGAFDKVEGGKLFLKGADGNALPEVELSTLRPAAVRYAKALAAPGAEAPASAETKPAMEKWTNSKGKEIEATFVKLADGKVTLRLTIGKDYILLLRDLSVASQARAEQLADQAKK